MQERLRKIFNENLVKKSDNEVVAFLATHFKTLKES